MLDAEVMVPAACQGIVGVTVRAGDEELRELLWPVEDQRARICANAERALLHTLDGSCRTLIGAYAQLMPGNNLALTGLVARADGSYVRKLRIAGSEKDAARMGRELGEELAMGAPADLFA